MSFQRINELIVVKVTEFSGTTGVNKNGVPSVMLQCIAGKIPNKNTIDGTVAQRSGFVIGKTYLAQVRERGFDLVYGRDFTWIALQELTSLEVIQAKKELGEPVIIDVLKDRPEGYESVIKRKNDAVEGLQTKRIKEGNYIPAYPRSNVDHNTAQQIVEGTSITTADPQQANITPEDLKKASEEDKDKPVNKVAERNIQRARMLRAEYYGEHTSNLPDTPIEGNID